MLGANYQLSIDALPVSVAIYKLTENGEFVFVDFNNKAESLCNISRDTLIGKNVTDAFPGIEEMGLLDVFKRVHETGEEETLDIGMYEDSYISGWRKNVVSKLPDGNIITMYEDIDANDKYIKKFDELLHKKTQSIQNYTKDIEYQLSELQRQKLYLEKSQRIASIGVWELDVVNNTLYWSDEIYRIFDLDRTMFEPSYENLLSAIHPDDRDILNKEYTSSISEKRDYYCDHRIIRKDGTLSYVEERGEHTFDENGEVLKTVGVILDVSTRKELEMMLVSVNKDLDKRVKEEIEKNRLQAQHIQEQSRLAQMGEMISMIAHQWRQPLGAISSTAVNLKLKLQLEAFDLNSKEGIIEASEYFLKRLDNINDFVKNLTVTIDDFRDFYKPNKQSVSIKLEDVISKALNVIEASLLSNNIEIIKEYSSDDYIDLYDSEMMQVILNLFKNSQDNFREKKTKRPYIKIIIEDKTISICDNGGGIKENIIEKIFDPYFSTKSAKNGTGLGLYMSQTIVHEHHGGILSVFNTEDGVCFKIDLGVS